MLQLLDHQYAEQAIITKNKLRIIKVFWIHVCHFL